ncbi:PQQ-like beta-propeller repeat protein [Micromonospora sp. NBC_01740]|uniref:outer membrane protein assembly factor BamB family protein n=1 Tax=Micromonospora sp. NBC_01740 TaxID=2975986 RepID=UPI002E11C99F|nr:PQQ-like beta-propeller repeat protein [Micromonospora sp. NBC_01740]
MTVIDLGERRDVDGAAGPGPGRFLRRWAPALVALLCLVTSAAAAPWPAQPPGVTVPAGPDANLLFVEGVLLVAEPSGPGTVADGDPVSRLAAHRLPSGRPLWRVPLPAPGRVFHAVRAGDLLAVGLAGDRTASEVVGLSLADGGVRWRGAGQLHGATSAGHLLLSGFAGSSASVLRSVDPATGAVRWSQPLAFEDAHLSRRDQRISLLTVLAGGRLELRDPDTGAARAATTVPDRSRVLTVTEELVLLTDASGVLSGYEIPGLRRRWSVPRGPADQPDVYDCGALICVDDGSPATRLLDPATGALRWRSENAALGPVAVEGRLLAVRRASGGAAEHVLLDAATGQPVRQLGRWRAGAPWLSADATTVHRRQRDGRYLVGRIDERGEGVQVLAALRGVVGECGARESFVACRREDGGLGVWELPGDRDRKGRA